MFPSGFSRRTRQIATDFATDQTWNRPLEIKEEDRSERHESWVGCRTTNEGSCPSWAEIKASRKVPGLGMCCKGTSADMCGQRGHV